MLWAIVAAYERLTPELLATNVRDTLVCIPVVWLGQSLIDTIIKVLIMREDDVPADIVKLPYLINARICKQNWEIYKSFGSNVCGSKTSWGHIGVDEKPGSFVLQGKNLSD